jgi:hypothetical protein
MYNYYTLKSLAGEINLSPGNLDRYENIIAAAGSSVRSRVLDEASTRPAHEVPAGRLTAIASGCRQLGI